MNRRFDGHSAGLPVAGQFNAPVPSEQNLGYFVPISHGGNGYPGQDDDFGDSFDPIQLLIYIIRYRWLIVIILSCGILAGITFTSLQTPRYRAEVKLEVLLGPSGIISDLQVNQRLSPLRALGAVSTAAAKLRSRDLARRVVYELNLSEDPRFLFPPSRLSFANILRNVTNIEVDTGRSIESVDAETREKIAVGKVMSGIQVETPKFSTILSVYYENPLPAYASRIANQIANSFIDQGVDSSADTSRVLRDLIQERVKDVKAKLQKSEKELLDYARAEGISVTGDEVSLLAANITALNTSLGEAIQDRLAKEHIVKQIEEGNGTNLPQVLADPTIQGIQTSLIELQSEYQQKLAVFKPEFPEMVRLRGQINEMQRRITGIVGSIGDSLRLQYQGAVQRERDLRAKLDELEGLQADYQDKNINYTILKREVTSNRSQYDSLVEKLNKVGVATDANTKSAQVIESANTPSVPFTPVLPLNLAIAFALSAVFAAMLVYILELLNNTFSNPDDVESQLKVSLLGVIPKVSPERMEEEMQDPLSPTSEAFRSLRTSLQFTGVDGGPKTLLVTSSEPGEGKSTTVRKIAEEFAALGRSVLVIDADLRRPNMHRTAKIPNGLGLSNVLANTVNAENGNDYQVIQDTPWPGVALVTAGTPPPNPANLLMTEKMALFIHACSNEFDMVIIDAPPVIGLSDALILSRLAEGVLFVVSAKQVTRKSAQGALKRLQSVGANVLGAVMTKFDANSFEYNYAYKYMSYEYQSSGSDSALEGRVEPQQAIAGPDYGRGDNK